MAQMVALPMTKARMSRPGFWMYSWM